MNAIDYKKHYENDNIYYKEIIKEKLINIKLYEKNIYISYSYTVPKRIYAYFL